MEKQPEQIDNYRILREIGRGGMGAVYEGEHRECKNRVAIKVLLVDDEEIALARYRDVVARIRARKLVGAN